MKQSSLSSCVKQLFIFSLATLHQMPECFGYGVHGIVQDDRQFKESFFDPAETLLSISFSFIFAKVCGSPTKIQKC
jgi:hypothetical protein